MQALHRVVTAALDAKVDMMMVAGDLFDNARVASAVVEETLGELARLNMPVVVIPGNHDCVDEISIYRRVDLRAAGPHLRFAGNPAGERLIFDELGLAIWARGIEAHHPGHRPLAGYAPAAAGYWDVVLTHGHYVGRPNTYRSSQITGDEILALDCDYVALGHWHRFADVSQGSVTALYSGSPTEGAGAVVVCLDPRAGTRFERIALP